MRAKHKFWRRIVNSTRSGEQDNSSLADGIQTLTAKTAEEGRRAAIVRADEYWQNDEHARAFQALRRARLEFGPSASLQFEYGKKAYEFGRLWAAREALEDAVELDVTHLEAIELLLEANYSAPTAKGAVTQIITNLAKLLPYSEKFDVDAAAILLPSIRMVAIVDEKIRMLRYSKSPVARHIGILAVHSTAEWPSTNENHELHELIARLVIVLARREYDEAYSLLQKVPRQHWPVRALRLAIRKELRNQQFLEARILLERYLEICPNSDRAREKHSEIKDSPNYLSPSEIIADGFPFPEKTPNHVYVLNERRVIYLLHSSLPHHSVGYATRTHGLLKGIRSHGWDIDGVTRLGYPYDMPGMESLGPIAPTTRVDGVLYHRLSFEGEIEKKSPLQKYISRYVAALKKLAEPERPFVLHAASNYWNGLAGVTAARELGIPSIYEVRGLWEITRGSRNPDWVGGRMYRYMARLETEAARHADQVITITGALRDELVRRGIEEEKITVVPNGVDINRFEPRQKNMDLARRLGVQNKTVVGYVGSILNYEGIALLLDVAHRFKDERSDVVFLFVGDGAELEEYRYRVETEQLSDVVIFTGRVPHEEAEDYYSIIDICPFPRLPLPVCEIVSPLKPFEAMAMEKAVIGSNVAALAEIITDGVNGLLFEKGDPEDLARVIRVLVDNPNLRARLAEAGRNWVTQERDWNKLSEQIDAIYTSLGGRTK